MATFNKTITMEKNKIIDQLPSHLMQFVIDQPYNEYTALDQAVWRYVMRQNYNHLSKVAHESYVEGLKKTGISIDSIASMYGMNRILKDIGWAAVAVDGFIPPSAFMEFQAYKVLVIAADIRTINHIEYTPAPDIIHEAAGHAPIIADPEYAAYLRLFGEIGSKAISSKKDYELYEAIRHLSIIKEDPNTPEDEIHKGEKIIATIQENMGEPSEMAQIRNLHWWTVEYGLIGTLEEYRLYGAGLLSSIGESDSCMKENVKKLPYTIEAANYAFDITKPQPQLFVTPSFKHLTIVLNEFADNMALRTGGTEGLKKAISSENVATAVYNSGLQVSGIFTEIIDGKDKQPAYLKTSGPTALAIENKELPGHGKQYHAHGFGSPVGKLANTNKALEDFSDKDFSDVGIEKNKNAVLHFESGVLVEGILTDILHNKNGKAILLSFDKCKVTYKTLVLFDPAWGIYDMAVGSSVTSVFSGAADVEAYKPATIVPKETTHKIHHDETAKKLHNLYEKVRKYREGGIDANELKAIWETLAKNYFSDWLLPLEILEILKDLNVYPEIQHEIKNHLSQLKIKNPPLAKLIDDGLILIYQNGISKN